MLEIDRIYEGDCLDVMHEIDNDCIDLTITSPPYDNLRTYNGYKFDFEPTAKEIYRVTKPGGVVVWVVGDATINGSETGTSFRQALGFMDVGFKLHDTMIWEKPGFTATGALKVRYAQVFEYMFVFVKDKLKTFNPIKDRKNKGIRVIKGTIRNTDGTLKRMSNEGKILNDPYSQRYNVWHINNENSSKNRFHPAQFPESIANDHIVSWSNINDVVLDPMCGSGTTCKMAKQNNRHYIGIDISKEYCEIARNRINNNISKKLDSFL